jgi:hypothetical protein
MLLPASVQDYLLSLDGAQLKDFLGDVAAYTAEKTGEFVSVCAGPPPRPTPAIVESIGDLDDEREIDAIDSLDDLDWLNNLPTY